MTLDEVYERLAEIDREKNDDERAHGLEDQLYIDVLAHLAASGEALAGLALKARDIKFRRWCA